MGLEKKCLSSLRTSAVTAPLTFIGFSLYFALAAPGLAAHEQHNYRVIATDAALAGRQPERAQALLDPLRQGGDAGVLARQTEIDTAMRRAISPASLYTTAFRMPAVNCFGAAYTPGCEIWPGAHPADPASDIAQAAYRAFSQRDYADAADKAATIVAPAKGIDLRVMLHL